MGEDVGSSVAVSLGVSVGGGSGDCVGVDGVSVKADIVPVGLSSHGTEFFCPGKEKEDRKKIDPASRTARAGRLGRTRWVITIPRDPELRNCLSTPVL